MTEFKTDVSSNRYELIFSTDSKEKYEYIQASARHCIDEDIIKIYSEEFGHIPEILHAIEHCMGGDDSNCKGCPYQKAWIKDCFISRGFSLKTLKYYLEKLDETLTELEKEKRTRKLLEDELRRVQK